MAYQVVLQKRFFNKLLKVLDYLEREWSFVTAKNFLKKIDEKLIQLSRQPFSGSSSEVVGVRATLITRHNKLYYRIRSIQVIVLNMYDTRMNPVRRFC